jgi:hypothetical protein
MSASPAQELIPCVLYLLGIGGAQILRYMDSETGMHGPYVRYLGVMEHVQTLICV